MSKTVWASVTAVGDQSAYVAEISRLLRLVIPRIRARTAEDSFRHFCDKFARTFTARYSSAVFRCKKIGEHGAQQLLLDAQAIRALLLSAPTLRGSRSGTTGGEDDEAEGSDAIDDLAAPAPGGYVNFVQREMPRVEMLLKIIQSPKERFADTIKALWPNANADNVTQLLDLKSTPKKEQLAILVQLGLVKGATSGGLADVGAGMKEMGLGAKLTVAGGMGKLFGAMASKR
jgi:vacuolar protein sorting-associated protein 53